VSDLTKNTKNKVHMGIKRNMTAMNSMVLLIIYTILFLNVRFIYRFLDYIPHTSIITMLTIVFALVILCLYLSRTITRSAINELDKYDRKLNSLLNTMKQEVEDRKGVEKKLMQQVYYDALTNLPNRKLFMNKLSRVSERLRKHENYLFAILFMDVDNFKIVNDSLGHTIGDNLLVSISQRLKTCVRSVDTLARLAGDEFVILIDDIKDIKDAIDVANRVQKEIKLPFQLGGQEIFTSLSIGIATGDKSHENIEDYLRDADIAMYRAKDKGKSRYEMFGSDMHDSIMQRLKIEADLIKALEREEYFLHYQPIFSLTKKKIVGAEALVRWRHPKHGLIPPDNFIHISENTGIITKLGEWILRKACAQNKAWHDDGYKDLRIDVNFSARQFQQQDTLQMIKQVLCETGLPSKYLDIEITESIAMEDHSITLLNELSKMGVTTSIDDFGTGYSSLGSLKRFPINNIKIDKSFINDISKDEDVEAIIRAIIAMANALKINIIAEGIETKEQLEFLLLNNCDEMQGFICSPPLSEKEFTELLQTEK